MANRMRALFQQIECHFWDNHILGLDFFFLQPLSIHLVSYLHILHIQYIGVDRRITYMYYIHICEFQKQFTMFCHHKMNTTMQCYYKIAILST